MYISLKLYIYGNYQSQFYPSGNMFSLYLLFSLCYNSPMEKTNVILFILIMTAFFTLTVILPADSKAAEAEKLASFPELSLSSLRSKTFTKGFEDYLSDNVALRSAMLAAARKLESLQGVTPSTGLISKTYDYLLWSDRIMEVFHDKPAVTEGYAWAVNAVAAAVWESRPGAAVYCLLAPTQAEYLDSEYTGLSDSQKTAVDRVYGGLDEGVKAVDAWAAIKGHTDEYVYFRTDHHWTALGAYYAYTAFCEAAGLEAIPLEDYDAFEVEGFLGYLYNQRPTEGLAENADTITYYVLKDKSFTTYPTLIDTASDRYTMFIHGDNAYLAITTSVKNGRTAVVVKDSYANCFVPFLAPHYERIVVIDPRRFEEPFSITEEVLTYADADLIFVNYVFSTTFQDIVTLINSVR